MVTATVSIDEMAVKKLMQLFDRIQSVMPRRMAAEIRHAGVYVCKSLAARTPVAPKRIRKGEYQAMPSPVQPHYITTARGLMRRWLLTRKLGTPAQYTRDYYVTTQARKNEKGRMVGKRTAQERSELLRYHGGISPARRGLAKRSWGWIANQIYKGEGAFDASYKRSRGERRDPRGAVSGLFTTGSMFLSASATIANKLDYIGAIVTRGTVNEAFDAATNRLTYNLAQKLMEAEKAQAAKEISND